MLEARGYKILNELMEINHISKDLIPCTGIPRILMLYFALYYYHLIIYFYNTLYIVIV